MSAAARSSTASSSPAVDHAPGYLLALVSLGEGPQVVDVAGAPGCLFSLGTKFRAVAPTRWAVPLPESFGRAPEACKRRRLRGHGGAAKMQKCECLSERCPSPGPRPGMLDFSRRPVIGLL